MAENISVGAKIAELRKQQKLTQDELGDILGVSRQAVANWENGISMPKADSFLSICRAFGVNSDYFYGDGNLAEQSAQDSRVKPLPGRHGHEKLKIAAFVLGWAIAVFSIILVIIHNIYYASNSLDTIPFIYVFTRQFYFVIMVVAICLSVLMTFLTVKMVSQIYKTRKMKK